MAFLQTGAVVGIVIALVIGGWLESVVGWRMTFVIVSIPSLSLALIFYMTVPNTQASARRAFVRDRPEKAAWQELLSNRPYVLLCLAAGLQMVLLMGIPHWFQVYMERSYGLERVKVGRMIASMNALGMLLGIFAGGTAAEPLYVRTW